MGVGFSLHLALNLVDVHHLGGTRSKYFTGYGVVQGTVSIVSGTTDISCIQRRCSRELGLGVVGG